MARKRRIVERVGPELPAGYKGDPPPAPRYAVEGPLEERAEVETPFGRAWAEPGCYVLEDVDTGAFHVVHPDDFEVGYRPAG